MTKAIRIHETGGLDVLRWESVEVGDPGPGEARVRHTAIGVNFIDTYHRSGLYPADLPAILGTEGAGVVEAVGQGVNEVEPGNRVAYAGPIGSYSEARLIAAEKLVPLPQEISDEDAAAILLKGMTVRYLVRQTYRVAAGETVLIHAAAGGVGLIACQWASSLGATVIGTVGNDEKADLARKNGCHHPVVYTQEDFVTRVRELTEGQGVPVVYDSVGAATWEGSLDCLRPRGLMVSFGNASGAVPPFPPLTLAQKGSLFLTRPSLFHYAATRSEILESAAELFGVMTSGAVKATIGSRYNLEDAAEAQRALEERLTTGSTVLTP